MVLQPVNASLHFTLAGGDLYADRLQPQDHRCVLRYSCVKCCLHVHNLGQSVRTKKFCLLKRCVELKSHHFLASKLRVASGNNGAKEYRFATCKLIDCAQPLRRRRESGYDCIKCDHHYK